MTKRRSAQSPIPTEREIQVLNAITRYGTIAAAALEMELSRHTVDAHLDMLRQRSGFNFLPQILAWASVEGWIILGMPERRPRKPELALLPGGSQDGPPAAQDSQMIRKRAPRSPKAPSAKALRKPQQLAS